MIDIKETLTIKEENNMDEYKVTIDQDRYEELIRYEHELMMLENAIYDNLEIYTYSHDVDLRKTDQLLSVLRSYDHNRFAHKVEILQERIRKEEEGENDG
jgi:hypothetical protein